MRIARTLALTATLLAASSSLAQNALLQAGPWTPGHVPVYVNPGSGQPVVIDSGGSATVGPLLSVVGDLATWSNTAGTQLQDTPAGVGVLSALGLPVSGSGGMVLQNGATLNNTTLGSPAINNATFNAVSLSNLTLTTPTLVTGLSNGSFKPTADNAYTLGLYPGARWSEVYAVNGWFGIPASSIQINHSNVWAYSNNSASVSEISSYFNMGFASNTAGNEQGAIDVGIYVNGVPPAASGPGANGIIAATAALASGPTWTPAVDNVWALGGVGQGYTTAFLHAGLQSTNGGGLTIKDYTGALIGTFNTGSLVVSGVVNTNGYTVSTLPASPGAGARAYVTDATSCSARLGTLTGGGSTFCPAVYTGVSWAQD